MIKTYQIKNVFSTKLAKRFTVGKESKVIIFESKRKNGILTYETGDEAVQKAIESSKFFRSKQIVVTHTRENPNKTDEADDTDDAVEGVADEVTVYDEVTKFREAQEILTGEPYNVPKTSPDLRSKDAIKAKAEELGVSFPNLN